MRRGGNRSGLRHVWILPVVLVVLKNQAMICADDRIAECRQGRAPARLVDADSSIPHLDGAAFDVGGRASFHDERNRVSIQSKEKVEGSYRILIGP